MTEGSDALVFYILVPLFLAIGLYLIWYARRRKKMLENFAKENKLLLSPEQEGKLQRTLDNCFAFKENGLVRSFGQIATLVEGESVKIFRAVELLDLNPHATPESTHFSRIVALFDIPEEYDEFFILDKSMRARKRVPGSKSIKPKVTEIAKRIFAAREARHSLSITLTRGHGLIYFEPMVTGGDNISDVNCLYRVAKSFRKELSAKKS